MNKADRVLSLILMGLPAPSILMLIGWWGLLPFHPADDIYYLIFASAGFIAGIALNATLLRRFMLRLFDLPFLALCALMAFYSIMLYGFFMGFPVFNIIPGILGSYIAARSEVLHGSDRTSFQKNTRRIDMFSFILLLLLCIFTAVLTLREPTIQSQLKSMLGLPFAVTYPMIWSTILIGGAALLALQYCFSRLAQRHVRLQHIL